nr:MAG TPA: hypothetical protein [Caudoviricetes sp.]
MLSSERFNPVCVWLKCINRHSFEQVTMSRDDSQ